MRRTISVGKWLQMTPVAPALQATSFRSSRIRPRWFSATAAPSTDEEHHAVVSTFDLFSIGIGPSSSHTVGPMRAARIFIHDLTQHNILDKVRSLRVDVYGSLALTGVGHGTPNAILMGIQGEQPETVEPTTILSRVADIHTTKHVHLNGTHRIAFDPGKDLHMHYFGQLPQHPNGMRFTVFGEEGEMLATNEFFSIGGGFVVNEQTKLGENAFYRRDTSHEDVGTEAPSSTMADTPMVMERVDQNQIVAALPFKNAEDLLRVCRRENMTVAQVVYENELKWHTPQDITKKCLEIWNCMDASIRNGCLSREEFLPGKLRVRRRAPGLYSKLLRGLYPAAMTMEEEQRQGRSISGMDVVYPGARHGHSSLAHSVLPRRRMTRKLHLPALDYLSVYAIAVNEENAAGGRVVTAPTNGAAGVIPSVLKYHLEFISDHPQQDIIEFLLTSAAIGMLYKRGASISAAEVGCQGEVGVACSMAAAGFTAVMGGSVEQVENAAEIAMEHNLGLTCDPIDGLVQIPCIERNSMGAVKAVTAAQLSLNGDGTHRVSLDQVIETMRQTGVDMQQKYKETSQGGLAVNVPVC